MCTQNASIYIRTFNEEPEKKLSVKFLWRLRQHNKPITATLVNYDTNENYIKADNYTNRSQVQRNYE